MNEEQNHQEIFGEWLVMTRKDIFNWDVLVEELKKKGTYHQPINIWVTSKGQKDND